MPPGSSPGTSVCGAYAGYAIFNNGGANYTPDPGTKICVIQAQAAGVYLANAQYNVLWNVTLLDRGCAAPVAGSATQKSFASSPAKKYGFTLYFTPGNCPPAKADMVLEVTFK